MYLHRFVIGIRFNERMFRLPSVGGLVIDEILQLRESDKKIKDNYFTQISTPVTKSGEYSISLIDDKGENSLSILPDQFVFKKTAITDGSTVSIDKAIQEFEILWKAANKIVKFPSVRRIGFAGEFRINESEVDNSSRQLIEALTKLDVPDSCNRFQLNYEERDLTKEGKKVSIESDDFWNKFFSYYTSDIDETPEKGKINANMDIQKYYNPAKTDPTKELKSIQKRFTIEKTKFKKKLSDLGLS